MFTAMKCLLGITLFVSALLLKIRSLWASRSLKEPSAIMTFVILKVLECDRSAKSIFPPQKPAKYLLYCAEKDYLYVKENSSPLAITVIIFKPTCTVEPLFNEDLVPIIVKYIGKKTDVTKPRYSKYVFRVSRLALLDWPPVQLISGQTCYSTAVITFFFTPKLQAVFHWITQVIHSGIKFLLVSHGLNFYWILCLFYDTVFLRPHERIASGIRGLNS